MGEIDLTNERRWNKNPFAMNHLQSGIIDSAELRFRPMDKPDKPDKRKLLSELDWITMAVKNAGSADRLAQAIGRDRATIYTWMDAGHIANIDVATVAAVARISGIGIMELTGIEDIPELATHQRKLKVTPKSRRKRKKATPPEEN